MSTENPRVDTTDVSDQNEDSTDQSGELSDQASPERRALVICRSTLGWEICKGPDSPPEPTIPVGWDATKDGSERERPKKHNF